MTFPRTAEDHRVEAGERTYQVRRAMLDDVVRLVELLTDDVLGRTRESGDPAAYDAAFGRIDRDPHQFLAAVESPEAIIVATMQLTLVPGLSRGGATRMQIEGVRVAASERGRGLGAALIAWAERFARANGATLLQLTTDKTRTDAHRFYERLGFEASHVGYKRAI